MLGIGISFSTGGFDLDDYFRAATYLIVIYIVVSVLLTFTI